MPNGMKTVAIFAAAALLAQAAPASALDACPDLSSNDGSQICTTHCTCIDEAGVCGCCSTNCVDKAPAVEGAPGADKTPARPPADPNSGDSGQKGKPSGKGNPVNLLLGLIVVGLAVYMAYYLAGNKADVDKKLSSQNDLRLPVGGFVFAF